MKRLISFILIIVLLLSLIGGCSPDEQSPLRICIDIKDLLAMGLNDDIASVQSNAESSAAEMFRKSIADREGPEDVEFEFIPASGQERDSVISRIRTELISGKGPDVFIVNCLNDPQADALFKSPRAIMELNLFLPLDKYIEKAEYMEWDKLNPVIMDAGKNENGQQLLPLTYTFPVSMCKKQDVSFKVSNDMNLYDMLDGGPQSAAFALTNTFYRHAWSDYAFASVADYDNEQLLFTEEDLLKWEKAQQEWSNRSVNGEFDDAPPHYSMSMNVGFDRDGNQQVDELYRSVSDGEEIAFVPMYSTQGGVAATVLSFAGINRNTKRADDAFRVLDILLSKDMQQYSEIFKMLTDMRGVPVHQELMQEEYPVGGWSMSDSVYKEFCDVRDMITVAKFRTEFENELFTLDGECYKEGTDIEKAVSKTYTTMEMMLAES